jgi:hypothetical protein
MYISKYGSAKVEKWEYGGSAIWEVNNEMVITLNYTTTQYAAGFMIHPQVRDAFVENAYTTTVTYEYIDNLKSLLKEDPNQNGKPLANWNMGLMKVIKHNKGTDVYDLATDVTDADGYYCLNWDGEARTLRGVSTYKSGPYTFTYHVYEKLTTGWKNVSIEKGPNFSTLSVVPNGDIKKDGVYVSTQIGEQNGYIYANAAYHVDFYNQLLKDKSKDVKKGNNGHGNDADHNDDSNPGRSNDKNDNTDDDGYPRGQINTDNFYQVSEDKGFSGKVKNGINRLYQYWWFCMGKKHN